MQEADFQMSDTRLVSWEGSLCNMIKSSETATTLLNMTHAGIHRSAATLNHWQLRWITLINILQSNILLGHPGFWQAHSLWDRSTLMMLIPQQNCVLPPHPKNMLSNCPNDMTKSLKYWPGLKVQIWLSIHETCLKNYDPWRLHHGSESYLSRNRHVTWLHLWCPAPGCWSFESRGVQVPSALAFPVIVEQTPC